MLRLYTIISKGSYCIDIGIDQYQHINTWCQYRN